MGDPNHAIFNIQSAILNQATALPEISLGTAAVVIFLGCLCFVMIRGISRLLVGTAVLTVSALFGYFVWQKAPELSIDWFGRSVGYITTGLPIAVFIVAFVIIRLALKWVATPFGIGRSKDKAPSKGGIPVFKMSILLAIALIPTFVVMLIAIGIIHHTATINELRHYADDTGPATSTPFIQQLNQSIEATVPESLLNTMDPFAERSRLALAKWITRQSKPDLEPVIDPETGKPIPRAIIVEEPELEKLAREQKFGTLLRHPVITKALEDPDIRRLLKDIKM